MSLTREDFAARRKQLLERIGPGVAVFFSAPVSVRNRDVEHPYRQDSDFYYLTGFEEPDAVLLLTNQHPDHRTVLFVRPRDPKRELWDGPRAGVEGAIEHYGADAAFPTSEFVEKASEYFVNVRRLHVHLRAHPESDELLFAAIDRVRTRIREGIRTPSEIVTPDESLHELRLRKSPKEVALMRRAVEIASEGHRRAMRLAAPGRYEYEIEAELLRTFHASGANGPAYGSIVGSGANATVLHYRANNRCLEEGDLLLIDAGCEYAYYASDITRTFPVSGTFSAAQRSIYQLVLDAQKAAIEQVRPDSTLDDVHAAAVEVLAQGLLRLGLLTGSVDEIVETKSYRTFYMHRTSHWIGMDVHDVGWYFESGAPRPMQPGFVITVEPGLYIPGDADVDPKWKGIGVRIEDDILVTERGYENLSRDLPKEADEVEALVQSKH